ncbi:uncharacterized protein LOC133518140 [Cydia pomonella]|uniref:uncharacterized protein LOC133518140 n=1 Tax=Cydia pomonella TaxID=82600 RepID=UPI002ADE8E7F|nr:uncharacterized protein LOC133518140 [Cydia pomonella]
MNFIIVMMHLVCKIYVLTLTVVMIGVLTGNLRLRYTKYEACIEGKYYSRRHIISGKITDQLAIDRKNNILYLQFNDNWNIGIFLHNRTQWLVNRISTSGMVVDQHHSILYMGTKERCRQYLYYFLRNTTSIKDCDDHFWGHPTQDKMMFNCRRVFYVDKSKPGIFSHYEYNDYRGKVYVIGRLAHLTSYVFEDVAFVCVEGVYNIVFVTNSTVYHFKNYAPKKPIEIARNKYVLSSYTGNAFLAHPTHKIIFKYNPINLTKTLYATYKSALLKDFVFDINNNIVFHDASGSVAQWVPVPGNTSCLL